MAVDDIKQLGDDHSRLVSALVHAQQRIQILTAAEKTNELTIVQMRSDFSAQSKRYDDEIARSNRQLDLLQTASQLERETMRQEIARFFDFMKLSNT